MKTNEDYKNILMRYNLIDIIGEFKGAKKPHKMRCMVCDHIWVATPISKRQTYKKHGVSGCPNCNTRRKEQAYNQSRKRNLDYISSKFDILTEEYDGRRHIENNMTYTKIKVRNKKCGHIFECSPSNLLTQHVECAICGPELRAAPLTVWSKQNSENWKKTATEWQRYKAEVIKLTNKTYSTHSKHINPYNLPRGKAGVPGAYHLDHKVPIRFCFDHQIPASLCASVENLQMIGWEDNVGSRCHIKGQVPHSFMPYLNNMGALRDTMNLFHRKIGPSFQPNVEKGGVLLSFYDPNANVGIVIIPTTSQFANQKSAQLAHKAIGATVNLFIIFDDELMTNLELVVCKLKHYTNKNTNAPKIPARKCKVGIIDNKTKNQFLDAYHIQGKDNAQLNYGAFFNNELVAVMTFTSPRVALGQKGDRQRFVGQWELSRFATISSSRVIGIASKILEHFKRNHDWVEIYSYADKRWSIGNMYHKLGFEMKRSNPPDYFYVIDGKRKHRWNYRKDLLKTKLPNYDPSLTEYENMVNHGYWRVWDCGTLKFTLHNR